MTTRLTILIAGLVLFAVVHSVLAASGVRERLERLARGHAPMYRLAYNVFSVASLAVLLVITRGDYPIVWDARGALRIGLRGVQGAALVVFLTTLRTFDLAHFAGLRQLGGEMLERRGLQTRGVYAICRHPMYLSVCIFFSTWPTMDLRMLIAGVWLWGYSYVGSVFEERKLVAGFGEPYRRYQATHPRILPLRPPSVRRRDRADRV